jgi:hypothetical protein
MKNYTLSIITLLSLSFSGCFDASGTQDLNSIGDPFSTPNSSSLVTTTDEEVENTSDNSSDDSSSTLTNGLVAHYKFEDNANDSSGNGNNGTANGGVTYTTGVVGSKAASFDGVDDYINIGSIYDVDTNDLGISLWVSFDTNASDNQFLTNGSTSMSDQNYFALTYANGGTSKIRFASQGDTWENLYTSSTQSTDTWYYIYIEKVGSTAKIYIDGVLSSSSSDHGGDIGNVYDWVIGKGHQDQLFDGLIDDLRIYNRALTTDEISTLYDMGSTITHNGTSYGKVTSPTTGKVWLDRNLGASQVCTSSTDTACYGDYYQWGRDADGHEDSSSNTTAALASNVTTVGHGDFITNSSSPYDWASVDSDGSTRSANWAKTDGTSICPSGYRVPTKVEIEAEMTGVSNATDAYSSFLKLPVAGGRRDTAVQYNVGANGYIWSSTPDSTNAKYFHYGSSDADFNDSLRAYGRSVRCIKAD